MSKMAKAFQDWLDEQSRETGTPYAAAQLARVPILMANTNFDFVISRKAAKNFMDAATDSNTQPSLRMSHNAPVRQHVAHNAMSTSLNPNFNYLLNASVDFFRLDEEGQ